MSTRPTFVIFPNDDGWKVVGGDAPGALRDVTFPAGATPQQTMAAAIEALRELIPAGAAVTLALPSNWCLCASVDATELPRSSSSSSSWRAALLYKLEEKLPVAAEEIVADFVAGADGRCLGVAAQLRRLEPIVRGLENAGWVVDDLCPAALLAAQIYLDLPDATACDALLFAHAGQLELILTAGGRLADWDVLNTDADDVALELSMRAIRHSPPLRLACAGAAADVMVRLHDISQLQVMEVELPPPEQAAVQMARASADGGPGPWVQLRRDALGAADPYRPARRAMNAALVGGVIFCACLCGAFLWRAAAYHRMAGRYERDQAEVFAKVFDGKRAPEGLNIASRLASEERRLRAMAGESLDVLPSRTSALALLHRVLAHVPADARCRVGELRINEDKLYVEGTAPSHADAASFAAALAADPMIAIDAPHTEQLAGEGGVAMRVSGVVNATVPPRSPSPTTRRAAP